MVAEIVVEMLVEMEEDSMCHTKPKITVETVEEAEEVEEAGEVDEAKEAILT
jgi:hypothetical protein